MRLGKNFSRYDFIKFMRTFILECSIFVGGWKSVSGIEIKILFTFLFKRKKKFGKKNSKQFIINFNWNLFIGTYIVNFY